MIKTVIWIFLLFAVAWICLGICIMQSCHRADKNLAEAISKNSTSQPTQVVTLKYAVPFTNGTPNLLEKAWKEGFVDGYIVGYTNSMDFCTRTLRGGSNLNTIVQAARAERDIIILDALSKNPYINQQTTNP